MADVPILPTFKNAEALGADMIEKVNAGLLEVFTDLGARTTDLARRGFDTEPMHRVVVTMLRDLADKMEAGIEAGLALRSGR